MLLLWKNILARSIAWKILYYLNVSPCCCKQTCLWSLSGVLPGTKVQYVTQGHVCMFTWVAATSRPAVKHEWMADSCLNLYLPQRGVYFGSCRLIHGSDCRQAPCTLSTFMCAVWEKLDVKNNLKRGTREKSCIREHNMNILIVKAAPSHFPLYVARTDGMLKAISIWISKWVPLQDFNVCFNIIFPSNMFPANLVQATFQQVSSALRYNKSMKIMFHARWQTLCLKKFGKILISSLEIF